MTPEDAKKILSLRRGPADDSDPEIAAALAMAAADPQLRAWLATQERFHQDLRASFRNLPVPENLASRILAAAKPPAPWWSRPTVWVTAAAAVVVLAGLVAALALYSLPPGRAEAFDTFRSRMVRSILRQYQMDLETNSMPAIRQFLTAHQSPSDYVLMSGLGRLTPRGAGLQTWLNHRVSMVCFNANGQGTAILFVADSDHLKNPPPVAPEFALVSKLMTASWTAQGHVYLLMVDNPTVDRDRLARLLHGNG